MLWSVKKLHGLRIHAADGELGSVEDCFFDDERWTVRYLIVNTGGWLVGRRVLISPIAVDRIDWPSHCLDVRLTRDEIARSPDIDSTSAPSPEQELEYFRYFRWPVYWMGGLAWGAAAYPGLILPPPTREEETASTADATAIPAQPIHRLRSAGEVNGYYLHATDGEIGHVEDLLVDDRSWSIQYLVAGTRNWWPGKRVLLPTRWLTTVSWNDACVEVSVPRAAVREAPCCPNEPCVGPDVEAAVREYAERTATETAEDEVEQLTR